MPREICPNCQRPPKVCYCSALVRIANCIKVLIIQHPLEQKHPFNTGRMAHLCLENSELVVAEKLSEDELAQLLAPSSGLLYPSLGWLPPVAPAERSELEQLVVIDATWRKSKKILHLHPVLQRLPRISLEGGLKSNYQIRRSSLANSLSTLESIAMAMQQLEPARDFQAMLQPFERMVALQKRF
ncbi:DTW domain-containing protein [Microbulbifer thermotolerans]|uniref:tRNA-uridine aminocarboxypropyltransferase n=1 Tax=Microbulbifer thermotolerans TaxID=252514 RepID=UPI0008EBF9B8|nr:tRNA-uridine aminocarboxypropyltransferase [Microbulbifer thermotolerans]MCX2779115.1 DTW domain-containing protein [Microbulbifer thermotolerans]MCX2782699.1 DTW domain-containing protein [Microbulbifer thermotolerans]MCX2795647.1 DTW domain-containing protein [Microbulbifer thermotolerans]MCX2805253.1 DTW domain-containing protein [Microbulbifer thermotolerans]MCX2831768.1 DTW domain-containing protein [Microbulbifer thermotolerans]